jgi:hypothetical protein
MIDRPKSKSDINHPSINTVEVKVQSVRTVEFASNADGGNSIGTNIDALLADCYHDGWYPNKLTVAINPRPENRPEQI